jgi:hypothetical protein
MENEQDGFIEEVDATTEEDMPIFGESPVESAMKAVQMHIHKNIDELPDSITYGTPGKLGECKVYFNSNDPKQAEERIVNALKLRKFMRDQEAIIEGTIK